MKAIHWRLIIIGAVIAVTVYMAWPRKAGEYINLNLGLDLKGGSHLLMQVITDDAIRAESDVIATRIGERLRSEGFPGARAVPGELGEIEFTNIASERLADAQALVEEQIAAGWSVSRRDGNLFAQMPNAEMDALRDQAVRQVLNTIGNRIDEFGVAEPQLQRVGGGSGDRLLLQLPGVEDPSRVKSILQTQAQLEFRMAYYGAGNSAPIRGVTPDDILRQLGGQLPPGTEILPVEQKNPATGELETAEYMLVEKATVVTGSDLRTANPSRDQWGGDCVAFELQIDAGTRMERHTRENIGRVMTIVLDGKIKSYPNIQSAFSTSAQITGSYTYDEVYDLALVLRAGALPARVVTIEERTVGPSLGLDSIKQGISAIVLGFILVMLFMVVYYKVAGINAVVALVLNLLIVAAVMAAIGATLTLPGIGGFILTVGMAVDANVLIFERIREEMRAGKTVRGSLEGGFGKALSAILDANITTLIAALFLFNYGTGPVRGFAVTLFIGIIASLFTAIFVSRTLFELFLGRKANARLSI